MTENSTNSPVSAEAHARMTSERDKALNRVAELEQLVVSANQAANTALAREKYLEHRASNDPNIQSLLTEVRLATPLIEGTDPEQIAERVQTVAAEMAAFRGPTVTTETATSTDSAPVEEPAAAPETAIPGIPRPNPGAAGEPARVKIESTEDRSELVRTGGLAAARAAMADGRLQLREEVRRNHPELG